MRETVEQLNMLGESGVDQPAVADLTYDGGTDNTTITLPDGVAAQGARAGVLEATTREDEEFGGLTEAADDVRNMEGMGNVISTAKDHGELVDDFRYQYGHAVVALAEAHARAVIEEDELGEQRASDLLAQEIAAIREDFDKWDDGLLDPESDAYFEATGILWHFNDQDREHLPVTMVHVATDETDMDNFLPGRLKAETHDPYDDGADPQMFGWFKSLSDERLINYFQWSEARTDAVSDALAERREDIKQNVREDFNYLIEDELVPESAREALENGFRYTKRFGALSSIESGYYHAAGLFDGDARRIGVQREYDVRDAEKYITYSHRYFFHEDLHALDAANNMGLTYLESTEEEPLIWVDEAVKEHLTLSAAFGQSNIVDPAERADRGAYTDLRELLHLVLTGGDVEIDLAEVTFANFERMGSDGQFRSKLAGRLRESYQDKSLGIQPGETILHAIAKEINAAPKPLRTQVAQQWIQKMYRVKGIELLTDLSDEVPTERSDPTTLEKQ